MSNRSLLFADESHQLQFPLLQELQPVLQILVEHLNLLVLIVLVLATLELGRTAVGLELEDLVLNLRDLAPDHLVLGHQVAIYILLVYVLL
jgi:hypothetical protein